jgi:hypothetical protein
MESFEHILRRRIVHRVVAHVPREKGAKLGSCLCDRRVRHACAQTGDAEQEKRSGFETAHGRLAIMWRATRAPPRSAWVDGHSPAYRDQGPTAYLRSTVFLAETLQSFDALTRPTARCPQEEPRRFAHDPYPEDTPGTGKESNSQPAQARSRTRSRLRMTRTLHGWPPSPCGFDRVLDCGTFQLPRWSGRQPLHPIYPLGEQLGQRVLPRRKTSVALAGKRHPHRPRPHRQPAGQDG